jgi:glycine cleavage system H protein
MRNKAPGEHTPQSKTAQDRCIWMSAGVISFKLCPLHFDCDNCDFDEAMRSQVRSKKGKPKASSLPFETPTRPESSSDLGISSEKSLFFTFSPIQSDKKLHLHPAHLWIRQVEGRKWRIGIDILLAYTLPPPQRVELPKLSQKVIGDHVFAKVLSEPGEVLLTAPLSGRLVEVNAALVQQDPCGEGWLAAVDSSSDPSEMKKFLPGPAGSKFLEEEAQHLRFLLKHKGIGVDQTGDTLPDGGLRIEYLHPILSGQVCLRLALELTASGKQAW